MRRDGVVARRLAVKRLAWHAGGSRDGDAAKAAGGMMVAAGDG
jgi:hypothetical protein